MSDELLPFASGGAATPVGRTDRGPYSAPHWLTPEGSIDRRNEARHAVAVRQATRDVEIARVEVAKKLASTLDVLEAEARTLTEQKYHLHRAQKESQILGGDDPELRAKFAVLDDDLFGKWRQRGVGGR